MYEWWYRVAAPFPILAKGGPVMLPIVLCSSMVVAIALERLWVLLFRVKRIIPPGLFEELKLLLEKGEMEKARWLIERSHTSLGRILDTGIKNQGAARDILKESLEEAGRRESDWMSRYLGLLATLANVSLLLGLLGTVTGMIRLFGVISEQGPGNPTALASGIAEALITTAAGLIIAIPTRLIHHYFSSRINHLVGLLEEKAGEFLNLSGKIGKRETGESAK